MLWGKTTKDIGAKGEKAAAVYLKKQGYKIICKNFSSSHGEIDIIAEDKNFLVFVEVKTRKNIEDNFKNYGRPGEAVDKTKQKHIVSTAKVYLSKHHSDKELRFDVIEVYYDDKIKINHIEDAFIL